MADRPTRPMMHRSRTSEGSFHDEHLMQESRARQSTRDSRRQRSTTVRTSSPEGPPFACPYSKHNAVRYSHKNVDEQDYRNCSSGYWTSIPRLKQHLYRTHDRSLRCCPRCWQNFPNDESLRRHVETLECQPRAMPEEKMDEEKHQKVKERIQGKPIESWYTIYRILFPEDDFPPTPFAEWVTGSDLRDCFEMLAQRLPRLLFQAAVHEQPAAGNIQLQQNTRFPTSPDVIQRALLYCQKQFGTDKKLAHVFATGPPPFTGSSRSSTGRTSQTVSPNQARHSRNVSEADEYEDSSSDMSYHESVPGRPAAAYQPHTIPTSMGQPMYQQNMAYTTAGYHAATVAPMEGLLAALDMQEEDYSGYDMENM